MIQLCCHRIMHIHLRALLWSPPRAPFKYRFVAHVNWTWFSIRFYALSVGSQGQTEVKTSASLATDNNKPSYYNVLAAAANQRLHETWQAIQGFLLLACWHFADCSYASSSSVRFLKEQGKKRKEPKFTGWPFLFYFSLLHSTAADADGLFSFVSIHISTFWRPRKNCVVSFEFRVSNAPGALANEWTGSPI